MIFKVSLTPIRQLLDCNELIYILVFFVGEVYHRTSDSKNYFKPKELNYECKITVLGLWLL